MKRIVLTALVVLSFGRATPDGVMPDPQAPPAGAEFRLSAVQVGGVRRYTQADVIRISGLESGQSLNTAALNAAADRMMKSGLFRSVNYRYATTGAQISVTFEIVESEWTVPVVLENFVGFTDEELFAALREQVPSFDGTSPSTPEATDFIGRALQNLLAARRVEGRVSFVPLVDLKTRAQRYGYKIEPGPKLCALSADGELAASDKEFAEAMRSVTGTDYLRSYVAGFADGTLLDMYHRRGRWRASFAGSSAAMSQAAGCSGVAAILHVSEGNTYGWERAEWSGNAGLPSSELDKLLQMKPGDVANVAEIDSGLRRVREAYGKVGYILQTSTYVPRLDDSTRRAVFQFSVSEGGQFHMGVVEFAGVSDGDAKRLQGRWRLKSGEVYNESYIQEFYASEIVAMRRQIAPPPTVDIELRLDRQQRLVNPRFVFK